METFQAITTRRTAKAFADPGPTAAQIDELLRLAACAPDHKKLTPWRTRVFTDHSPELAALLIEAEHARARDTGEDVHPDAEDRLRIKATRAPTTIVISCQQQGDVIPLVEQLLACGAFTQTLLLAATAMGFVSKWSSGRAARDPWVKAALGIAPEDEIIGFIYLGSPAQ
jgi:nitroreductase